MSGNFLMVGLGEILWDLLPSGRVLGGAPTNFAYMASVLGDQGIVASRIGSDNRGQEAKQQLERLGLSTAYLQRDSEYRTGEAGVSLDSAGQPTFTIENQVAWDCLRWTANWEGLAKRADVICFGSLAQRAPVSTRTIDRFLSNSRPDSLRIFDVNLRQSYYDAEILTRSLEHANVVKLSERELSVVASIFQLKRTDEESLARMLLRKWNLKLVCVTRGARGSFLASSNECTDHPGFAVKVVDAVGAGDAFTACLAHYYARGYSLIEISEYANRLASWVATKAGATPVINSGQVEKILRHGSPVRR